MKATTLAGFLLMAGTSLVLMVGCTTSALWQSDQLTRFHEPAASPNLQLSRSTRDQEVLVEYDEWREGSTQQRHRAYWLGENEHRIRAGRKPKFVSITDQTELETIPVG